MNALPSFVLPAVLGLMAGVGHGVVSHNADLPFALSDQVMSVVGAESDSSALDWGEE